MHELLSSKSHFDWAVVSTTWACAGLQKRYKIPCLDAEVLQASIDKNSLQVSLLAEAGEFSRYGSAICI